MSVRILIGDCRAVLRTLPDESVHCVVTSPPYWGLRDYGVDGAIGLEATLAEHVDGIVAVFDEVRRVLRKDGTLWLNYGDAYASGGKGGYPAVASSTLEGSQSSQQNFVRKSRDANIRDDGSLSYRAGGNAVKVSGLKPKDLIGMPWRIAFALQASGWWLRQDIIWHKPNPMPESTGDRCTKSHEYLFLLSKSERYHYDQDAIREPAGYNPNDTKFPDGWDTAEGAHGTVHRNGREKGRRSHVPGNKSHKGTAAYEAGDVRHRTKAGLVDYAKRTRDIAEAARPPNSRPHSLSAFEAEHDRNYATRNKRSVWTVATAPFREAHFATFPPALIEPCIKAGCPRGGVVLDPFGGAGTTGLVADRLQRDAILIELNPEYAAMARKRIDGDAGGLPLLRAAEAAAAGATPAPEPEWARIGRLGQQAYGRAVAETKVRDERFNP